jgi:hypothetical protein
MYLHNHIPAKTAELPEKNFPESPVILPSGRGYGAHRPRVKTAFASNLLADPLLGIVGQKKIYEVGRPTPAHTES